MQIVVYLLNWFYKGEKNDGVQNISSFISCLIENSEKPCQSQKSGVRDTYGDYTYCYTESKQVFQPDLLIYWWICPQKHPACHMLVKNVGHHLTTWNSRIFYWQMHWKISFLLLFTLTFSILCFFYFFSTVNGDKHDICIRLAYSLKKNIPEYMKIMFTFLHIDV